jgi:NAD(P)-dependent dehydrogenase (short-subunit alcohol dehydrogenase family)
VACIDVEPEQADKVAGEVDGIGLTADATDAENLAEAFARAEQELDGIDGLVDIIGRNRPRREDESHTRYWRGIMNVNLMHAVEAAQIGGEAIERAGGGTMAFVVSGLAFKGDPRNSAYAAAKASLVSLIRSTALRLGPAGIRVNGVAPGTVATPGSARRKGDDADAIFEKQAATAPFRGVNLPSDVAATLLFLSSPLSSNITGQTIILDGGRSAR